MLFFIANDGIRGEELWKSDGTAAGTVLVRDIVSGIGGSLPSNLVNVSGTLYFTAANSVGGRELWKSNGTAAGTVRVKDISPGGEQLGPEFVDERKRNALFCSHRFEQRH